MDLKTHIQTIADFPKPGIQFRDIMPLLANADAFAHAIDRLVERARACGAEVVVGVESRGFIFGAPVAKELGLGLVLLRKPGKLPGACVELSYDLEYGSSTLQLQKGRLGPGQRVFLVDDLLATGGTAAAAAQLVEMVGATVAELAFVIELVGIGGAEAVSAWPISRLIEFPADGD